MFGFTRKTEAAQETAGMTRGVNLPQPPLADPHRASGRAQDDARQSAQRDFTSGAVDAVSIEAGEGPLLYDQLRDHECDIELEEALKCRREAETIGRRFIDDARQGRSV